MWVLKDWMKYASEIRKREGSEFLEIIDINELANAFVWFEWEEVVNVWKLCFHAIGALGGLLILAS